MKQVALFVSFILLVVPIGCTTSPTPAVTHQSEPTAAPTPKSAWITQLPKINPIDESKEQILRLYANERLPHRDVQLVLCFRNGKLISSPNVGVRVDVGGFVSDSNGAVRLRFDNEAATRSTWGRTSSHDALYPPDQTRMLMQLMHHSKLAVEFSLYEEAAETVTFDLTGLADEMKSAGLSDPTASVKAQDQRATQLKKQCDELDAQLSDLYAGSPEWDAMNRKIRQVCGR
jgi:hypothetical protein